MSAALFLHPCCCRWACAVCVRATAREIRLTKLSIVSYHNYTGEKKITTPQMDLWLMLHLMHSRGIRHMIYTCHGGDMLYLGILDLGIVICFKCCPCRRIVNYYLLQWNRLTAAAITIFQCHLASTSYKYTVESCYHLHCLLTDSQVAQTAFGFIEDNRKRAIMEMTVQPTHTLWAAPLQC